ncbi:MAG: indole-3-glycerol phosphate synthase TrpC [Prevotella sp.]|nr:indole-3-glycerol phosphate synthase TrpC [Prevotella sp.]
MNQQHDILETIIAHKRKELETFKQRRPEKSLCLAAEQYVENLPIVSMRESLLQSSTGIIAEYKRKSPSKGWFLKDDLSTVIPLSYQQHGASALSILTDEYFFGGSDVFIREARNSGVTLPILYKNFIIEEYQLYQAVLSGASAVLLIAAVLSKEECRRLMDRAHSLHLEVLLEMHSEEECSYADLEPDMCGINNRHLGTFVTDVETSFRLAECLPKDACLVSESGISDPQTVVALRRAGYRGFLMGEHFMRSATPGDSLQSFIDGVLSAPENNP